MLSWEGPLCHKHTNKEIRCFANFFSEETAHLFFNGHSVSIIESTALIYICCLREQITQVLSAAAELWRKREKGNLKEIYHFFYFILLIQII